MNKNGNPNDFALDAGLKQCTVIIPVNKKSMLINNANTIKHKSD